MKTHKSNFCTRIHEAAFKQVKIAVYFDMFFSSFINISKRARGSIQARAIILVFSELNIHHFSIYTQGNALISNAY